MKDNTVERILSFLKEQQDMCPMNDTLSQMIQQPSIAYGTDDELSDDKLVFVQAARKDFVGRRDQNKFGKETD